MRIAPLIERVVVTLAVIVVVGFSGACATSKSIVVIPACADRVEIEGQASRLSKNKFELDHTFDLPFSRTELQMKTPTGERDFELIDSQPDSLRLFAGAASGLVGGALIAASAYNVTAQQQDFFTAIPFYQAVFGGGLVVLGVVGVGTGWHPPSRVFRFPDDVCPDRPATKAKPQRTRPGPPRARVRAVPPTPPPLEDAPSPPDGTYER